MIPITDEHFSGIYGNRLCTNCSRPFSEHEAARSYHCPRFTVPPRIVALWASFGNRAAQACNEPACPVCTHS